MSVLKSSLFDAIFDVINLPSDAAVADLGCRNAAYLNELISRFPDKVSKAIGIDVTDKGFNSVPYCNPVELKVMNCAGKIDFHDNEFDLVFTKDLLECISDKSAFINEINRILKPGGTVVCVHADFDSVVYNGENQELITKCIHAYAITKQGWMDDLDGWMGRRLYGNFNGSGFFESEIYVHSVVETEYKEGMYGYEFSRDISWLTGKNISVLSNEEYSCFINDLIESDKNGSYLFSKPYYIYKGTKI